MITKIIATFPCGNKLIRTMVDDTPMYFKGIKLSGSRPYLVQVFGRNFNEFEKEFIYRHTKMILHPVHRRITLNGEFLNTPVDTH